MITFFDTIQRLIINIMLEVGSDYVTGISDNEYNDGEEIRGGENHTKDINAMEEILPSSNTTSFSTSNTTIGKIDPIFFYNHSINSKKAPCYFFSSSFYFF